MARDWRQGELNGLALLAAGVILVSMSAGGYVLGAIIDRLAHTSPYGALVGLLIGTIAGFWDLYRIAARVMNQQPAPPSSSTDEPVRDDSEREEDHEL